MNLCECGCGKECKRRFVNGHISRTKDNPFYKYKNTGPGWNLGKTKEKDGITSGRKKGSHLSENHKQNIRSGVKSFYNNPVKSAPARAAISKVHKRKTISEITRADISNSLMGHAVSEMVRAKIRTTKIEQKRITPAVVRLRQSYSHKKRLLENPLELVRLRQQLKDVREDPEVYKKVFSRREMSEPEVAMAKLLDKANLSYVYVGNFQFRIGKRWPDFIDKKTNRLIEVFGDFYHKGEDPQLLIDYYKNFGYTCIVLWASEIYKDPEATLQKILASHDMEQK